METSLEHYKLKYVIEHNYRACNHHKMTSKSKEHPFKNHKIPLLMKLYFTGLTTSFKVLEVASPALAGRLALRLFMMPPSFPIPRREHKWRAEAALSHLNIRGRNISVRSWGDKSHPPILLSHGWGGRCTQLQAFIQPLLDANYRVIGFDVPGHGDSEGKFSNMLDVASIIAEIAKTETNNNTFDAIIGHSFGTSTALLALDKFAVKANKVVLIAYFADIHFITDLFGRLFNLKASTLKAMEQRALLTLGKTYNINWNWQSISPTETIKSLKADLLLVHDKDDHEVPYSQAERLQQVVPHAQTITTTGLGHRKILMKKEVIKSVVEFIHTN